MKNKSKKKTAKEKVNWASVIALSAAGQYIQSRLAEELKALSESK